jgi:hypothetical protein
VDFFVDNVSLTDAITPTQATLFATGAISMSGTETSTTTKKLVGAMTPGGVLTKSRAVLKVIVGAITPTGLLTKVAPKFFTGSIFPTNVLTKTASKKITGSITPTAFIRRGPARKFAGSVTPANSATNITFIGRVFGRPGIVVMSLVTRARVSIRHRKG